MLARQCRIKRLLLSFSTMAGVRAWSQRDVYGDISNVHSRRYTANRNEVLVGVGVYYYLLPDRKN